MAKPEFLFFKDVRNGGVGSLRVIKVNLVLLLPCIEEMSPCYICFATCHNEIRHQPKERNGPRGFSALNVN